MKVYCGKCRFLLRDIINCTHPKNIGDWYGETLPNGDPAYNRKPKEINANNDCTWFEPERRENI